MKKTLGSILLAGIVIFLYSCQSTQKGFDISGHITGNAEGKTVYLQKGETKSENIDSTVVKDGSFQFKGTVATPQLYKIVIAKNDTPSAPHRPIVQPVIPVFTENSDIQVSAVLDSIPLQDYFYYGPYKYNTVTIKGSASNDTYMNFLKGFEPLAQERRDIFMNDYIPYLNPEKGKEKGPVSEGIGIVTRIDQAADKRNAFVKDFIKKNSNDAVALYVAQSNLSSFSVKEIDEILSSLSSQLMDSQAGKELQEKAVEIKKTASGAKYADFAFQDDKGDSVKLSDHLGKGKYVLVEFWASWCGPCRADIPHLKEVYELYHPAGFEVISVSMDDDKDKWLKAIADEKMSWLQVSDLKAFTGNLSKLYNFNGIPTCVLIDPEGNIVTRNMRGSWMDKKLIELYGNKFGTKF